MAKASAPPPHTPITRDDLERRLQAFQAGVRGEVDDKKGTFMTAAGIGGLLVVIIIFMLGKRAGKKKTTFVEIRRV
jgi:hypothetical protein